VFRRPRYFNLAVRVGSRAQQRQRAMRFLTRKLGGVSVFPPTSDMSFSSCIVFQLPIVRDGLFLYCDSEVVKNTKRFIGTLAHSACWGTRRLTRTSCGIIRCLGFGLYYGITAYFQVFFNVYCLLVGR
jgi:hypothetical protein